MDIPDFLKKKLQKQYDENAINKILDGYYVKRKTTFRANILKTTVQNIENELKANNIKYQKLNWYNDGFIIENADENDIRNLDIYKNGEIYMQSLSSMIPALILDPKKSENILDMAAAPGGKTLQIATISNNESFITACEKNKIRCDRLKYNLEKQGVRSVNVMNIDSRKLDDFFSFDKILLDAPCSGSGTLHFENESQNFVKNFTEELIKRSVKFQQQLLKKAIKILKKNGEMVYSTCSILFEENEQIIEKYVKNGIIEIVPIDFDKYSDIPKLPTKIAGTMCVCPDEFYEGFFVAKFRKK